MKLVDIFLFALMLVIMPLVLLNMDKVPDLVKVFLLLAAVGLGVIGVLRKKHIIIQNSKIVWRLWIFFGILSTIDWAITMWIIHLNPYAVVYEQNFLVKSLVHSFGFTGAILSHIGVMIYWLYTTELMVIYIKRKILPIVIFTIGFLFAIVNNTVRWLV